MNLDIIPHHITLLSGGICACVNAHRVPLDLLLRKRTTGIRVYNLISNCNMS